MVGKPSGGKPRSPRDLASDASARSARFEAVTLPFAPGLYRYALRLARQPAEAEDLVQETYLRAWRAFKEGTLSEDCRPWFFRVLTNLFINRYRRRRREPLPMNLSQEGAYLGSLTAEEAAQAGEAAPDPAEQLDQRVKAAVDALRPEYRIVLLLAAVEGLSYGEIAEACGIPLGTVMSRLHRSRAQLRRQLRRYARQMGYDAD